MRNDQPGVLLVVGRHDVPGRRFCAGGAQTGLIGLHILLPVISFLNVGQAEFPVLFRFVDAFEKALPLLFL